MAYSPLTPSVTQSSLTYPAHRVYYRPTWSGSWTLLPYMYADFVHYGCGSEIGRAQLHWKYGRILQPGQTTVATYTTAESLLGSFVKIEIDQYDNDNVLQTPLYWYGLISEIADDQHGVDTSTGVSLRRGVQTIVCHGLELLADRVPILGSYVKSSSTDSYVRRGIQFNSERNYLDHTKTVDERKTLIYGNKSATPGMFGVPVFSNDLATALKWSSRDIVDYLLKYFPFSDPTGAWISVIGLTSRSDAVIMTQDSPVISTDGKTLRQLFGHLFDRRRMFSWRFTVNAATDQMLLDVFSLCDTNLPLPSGGVIYAASPSTSLNFESALDVRQCTIKTSAAHAVGRVICRGANKRACFSVSDADATLVEDWAAADETAYEAGPGSLGSLDFYQQKARLTAYRKEDRFKRVYSYFRLPSDWDGQVGDGIGGTKNPFFPVDDYWGAEALYGPESRFDRHLPLGVLTAAPSQSPDDAMQLAAWMLVYNDGAGGTGGTERWQHIEKMNMDRRVQMINGRPAIDFTCSIRPQEFAPGLVIKVSGSSDFGQEAIAATNFTKLSGVDLKTPPLDWLDMIVTGMLVLDSRVEGVWPSYTETSGAGQILRTMVVDFGNRYRLDYVAPGTVYGVTDGVLQHYSTGQYFRDDRQTLTDLARIIYLWYSRTRRAMSVALNGIRTPVDVGTIISGVTEAGVTASVNTVVTSVSFDLANGTTSFTTDFAELDPNQF